MTDLVSLRLHEARAHVIALACARAHQDAARVAADYASSDVVVNRAMQGARREALAAADRARVLAVRAALAHDLLASRLAVAELESIAMPSPEDLDRLARRRNELAIAEMHAARQRVCAYRAA